MSWRDNGQSAALPAGLGLGHEQQCKPNAETEFTLAMLRRSLLSLRSSNKVRSRRPRPWRPCILPILTPRLQKGLCQDSNTVPFFMVSGGVR